jgi:hypothetical protein
MKQNLAKERVEEFGPPLRESLTKRLFDLVLATFGFVLFLPLWILISVAIYFEDGRPILFIQKRVGKGGEEFTAYKFRTIYQRYDNEVAQGVAVHSDDKKVMRVGRILRRTALKAGFATRSGRASPALHRSLDHIIWIPETNFGTICSICESGAFGWISS